MKRVALWVAGGFLAFVLALAGYKYWRVASMIAQASAFPEPAEAVTAITPRPVRWSESLRVPGTIVARQSVTLSNELAGTVVQVAFRSGQVVERGQLLLALDTRSEAAELQAALADADLARLTVERKGRLLEQRAGAAAELDRARAELAQAEARAEIIRTTLARKVVRAPFRGRIGLRDVHPGQYLGEGTEITTLESIDDRVFVDFRVPQDAAARLTTGGAVRLQAQGAEGGSVEARVVAIDSRASEESRNVRVRAEAAAGGSPRLAPGSFVDVTLEVGEARPGIAVPLNAVRRAAYGDHVFVIRAVKPGEKGPRAEQRFVRLGAVQGQEVVIAEGLKPGERIAGEGSFKLREGTLLNVVQRTAEKPR